MNGKYDLDWWCICFHWKHSIDSYGDLCKEPEVSPIIFTLLKARAVKAFVSNAGGSSREKGRRGWGVVSRQYSWNRACQSGREWWNFLPPKNHTSFFPSSSSFPAFLFPVLLLPAGYCCENEALMGWADSTDKRGNWLVGCTYAYTFPHRGTLSHSFQLTLNWSTTCSCTRNTKWAFS